MPLLRINATDDALVLPDSAQPVGPRLRTLVKSPGPVVIMVHGYKYEPGNSNHCPHQKLYGPSPHAWPARLGLKNDGSDPGLGIAFGWAARGPLKQVHQRAASLGKKLADVVNMVRTLAPDKPIHLLGHSLGTETVLNALPLVAAGAISRIVLLTGASYAKHAKTMLNSPAGKHAEVLNMTSRENDIFDAVFERLIPAHGEKDCTLSQGIDAANVLTVQFDCNETLAALRRFGIPIAAPQKRICHWSTYRRPGAMQLYREFFWGADCLSFQDLITALPTDRAPRWSRLWTGPCGGKALFKIPLWPTSEAVGLRR